MASRLVRSVILATNIAVVTSAQAPPRDAPSPAPAGTATVRGRVSAAETSKPLRRAQIKLTSPALGPDGRTVSTDADGGYEFTELPAGRYTLTVSRSGYLPLRYGQRRPLEQGKPLQLVDHQVMEHVDIALPRMGAITGRITDELGEPFAGVTVFAMRSALWDGRRRLVPAGPAGRTDESGEYRLAGLAPGPYVVMARSAEKWTVGAGGREETMAYGPTYFPSTTSPADAKRIAVRSGQEAGSTDFPLIPGRAAKISGTAVTSQGRPLATVMLVQETLGPSGGFVGMAGSAAVGADGSFTIRNVPPGEYKLQAAKDQESIVMPVVVDGTDLDNVGLTASSGWSVSGKVTTDAGTPPGIPRAGVRIVARSLAVNGMGMAQSSPAGRPLIKDDWTFFAPGTPGPARLVVSLPEGWVVKGVLHDRRDITDTVIDLKSGEELAGVQVVITDHVTSVSGQLSDDDGAPLEDGTVMVFAAESTKWFDGSRFVQAVRPDQKGRYHIKGLPPGEYLAVAVTYVEDGMWSHPEYLESLRQHAQKLTLGDGEARTISLKLVTP